MHLATSLSGSVRVLKKMPRNLTAKRGIDLIKTIINRWTKKTSESFCSPGETRFFTLPPFDCVWWATPGAASRPTLGVHDALHSLMAGAQGRRFLSAKAYVGRLPLTLKLGKLKLEMEKNGKKMERMETVFFVCFFLFFADISEVLLEFC